MILWLDRDKNPTDPAPDESSIRTPPSMAILKRVLKHGVELAVILLICVLMLDGIIAFILHNPQSFPDNPLTRFIRLVNISSARVQPAYDPDCAKFDFEINYRYRPGSCRHASWEFDVTIEANSLGFPDDEESLERPEIVVLGDSYAAGWGVERLQAFPSLLENSTGRKVLVAAAPSYATARELRLLEDMDLSNVQTVIIQFSDNDAFENLEVVKNKEIRPIHHMVYRSITITNMKRKRYLERPYFPGKYLALVWFTFQQPAAPAPPSAEQQAKHVLALLARSLLAERTDIEIVIISINEHHESDREFIDHLNAFLDAEDAPALNRRITALSTSGDLAKEDYFILDDHLRPSGHEKVADLLRQHLP